MAVKLIGKLEDGTIFVKKGNDEEEPFEFKTDEGNNPFVVASKIKGLTLNITVMMLTTWALVMSRTSY